MLRRVGVLVGGVIGGIALSVVGMASPARAATGNQSFRIIFTGDPRAGTLGRVIANGVVNGIGTDQTVAQDPHPDGSETDTERITLPGGTLTILDTDPPDTATFDPTTCIATLAVTGAPYSITGGTGAYAGARGGGTFSASGVVVFNRIPGGCSEQARIFFADVRLSGTISLP